MKSISLVVIVVMVMLAEYQATPIVTSAATVMASLLVPCAGNSAQSTEVVLSPTESLTLVPTAAPTMVSTIMLEATTVPTEVHTATPDSRISVVLTIDDGWSREAFDVMLDILAENDSHATFFLVATASKILGPERITRLVKEGHEIAYHSFNHDALEVLQSWGTKEWSEDYEKWVAAMGDLLGPELYAQGVKPYARAPYKLLTSAFVRMSEDNHLQLVNWDTDVHAIHKIPAYEGDVILSHVRNSDLEVFRALLLNPSYRVVSLSEYLNRAPWLAKELSFLSPKPILGSAKIQ